MKSLWLVTIVTLLYLGGTAQAQLVDGDGDLVADDIDQCLYTPRGVVIDRRGCAKDEQGDSDRDGVRDAADSCPFSPSQSKVDARGCARDEDFDGVADTVDLCLATALGVPVNTVGCSQAQRQAVNAAPALAPEARRPPEVRIPILRDPVVTAIPKGRSAPVIVNAAEVPRAMRPAAVAEEGALLRTIVFKPGVGTLDSASQAELARVAEALLAKLPQRPQLRLQIIGYARHTDPKTDPGPSEDLAASRANQVKSHLIRLGIERERISSEGRIARKSDYKGTRETSNYRVELRILGLYDASTATTPRPAPRPTPTPPPSQPAAPLPEVVVVSPARATVADQQVAWVLFPGGSSVMDARAVQVIQAVMPQLRQELANTDSILEIRGGADRSAESGSASRLSAERAQRIRDYLIRQGIDPRRLRAIGRGDQDAVSQSNLLNRRADLWFVSKP